MHEGVLAHHLGHRDSLLVCAPSTQPSLSPCPSGPPTATPLCSSRSAFAAARPDSLPPPALAAASLHVLRTRRLQSAIDHWPSTALTTPSIRLRGMTSASTPSSASHISPAFTLLFPAPRSASLRPCFY